MYSYSIFYKIITFLPYTYNKLPVGLLQKCHYKLLISHKKYFRKILFLCVCEMVNGRFPFTFLHFASSDNGRHFRLLMCACCIYLGWFMFESNLFYLFLGRFSFVSFEFSFVFRKIYFLRVEIRGGSLKQDMLTFFFDFVFWQKYFLWCKTWIVSMHAIIPCIFLLCNFESIFIHKIYLYGSIWNAHTCKIENS